MLKSPSQILAFTVVLSGCGSMCDPVCIDSAMEYPQPADVEFRNNSWACDDNAIPVYHFYWETLDTFPYFADISQSHVTGSIWNPAADNWMASDDQGNTPDISLTMVLESVVRISNPGQFYGNNRNEIVVNPGHDADSLLALATIEYRLKNSNSAQYKECDVVFHTTSNPSLDGTTYVPIEWVYSSAGNGQHVIATALQHELGHCLGLEDEMNTSDVGETIMTGDIGLDPDNYDRDKAAILHLYGDTTP